MLASRNEVLQLDLVLQSKRDALFGQLHDLRVAPVVGSRPALDGGTRPTSRRSRGGDR